MRTALISLVFLALLSIEATGATFTTPAPGPLGPPTADLLGLDISAQTRPADDAVILYRGVSISVDAEGRITRRFRQVQRILTDLAVEQRGDPRVAYDTTRQELAIHVCRAFMKDGKEVAATSHSFNRVTPDRVASCPDWCGLQEMVLSYVGVERGCMTELDYSVTDRVAWRPWLEGIEDLGDTAPVLQGEVRLFADSLKTAFVGIPHADSGGRGVWLYGPLPGCPDEGGSSLRERTPYVVFSSCLSWKALSGWICGRLEQAAAPDSAIFGWARAPLECGHLPIAADEKLARAARLIAERTNAADDVPLSWWLPIRPAARTFDSSCGNLLDRAALAMAALTASGIGAEPRFVFASAGQDVPALAQFDDIRLVAGPIGSLSVGHGTAGFAVVAAPWGELNRDGAPQYLGRSDVRCDTDLSILIHENADGSVRGEAWVRIRNDLPDGTVFDDVKGYLGGLASRYAEQGELAGYRVRKLDGSGIEATFSFTGKALGESLGSGRRLFRIPSAPGAPDRFLPAGLSLRRGKRITPIVLPAAHARETVRLRLELAPRSRAVILPRPCKFESPSALLEATTERDGSAVVFTRRFEVSSSSDFRRIQPDEYPGFRSVVLHRIEGAANGIVIERRD